MNKKNTIKNGIIDGASRYTYSKMEEINKVYPFFSFGMQSKIIDFIHNDRMKFLTTREYSDKK